MCSVLDDVAAAAEAVPGLPSPNGLGAADVLAEQVAVLAAAVAVLQRELGLRMAALQAQDGAADVRGDAVRAGMAGSQAARLRRLGAFAQEHPALAEAWAAGRVGEDQVAALRDGAAGLPPRLRPELVARVLPELPGLDAKSARALVAYTVDLLDPATRTSRSSPITRRAISRGPRCPVAGWPFRATCPRQRHKPSRLPSRRCPRRREWPATDYRRGSAAPTR